MFRHDIQSPFRFLRLAIKQFPNIWLAVWAAEVDDCFTATGEHMHMRRQVVAKIDDDLVSIDTQNCWNKTNINLTAWV